MTQPSILDQCTALAEHLLARHGLNAFALDQPVALDQPEVTLADLHGTDEHTDVQDRAEQLARERADREATS